MIVDRSGHFILIETPSSDGRGRSRGVGMPAWALPAKKVSETPSPSFAFGAAGEEEPTRRPKGPFPPLPLFPPSLSSCHSIPANYRHGTRSFVALRWLVCVAPSLPPSLHVFTLSRGDENAGRASERGRIRRYRRRRVRRQHQCPSDCLACCSTDTRRPCPLILRVHCVPPSFRP